MSTKLENFVNMHRQELDAFLPSDNLWLNIQQRISNQGPSTSSGTGSGNASTITSKISWLKYFGYSASAIAVGIGITALLKMNNPENNNTSTIAAVQTEKQDPPVVPSAPKAPSAPTNELVITSALLKENVPVAPEPVLPSAPEKMENIFIPEPADPLSTPTFPSASSQPYFPASAGITAINIGKNGALHADTLFSGVKKLEVIVSSCDINVRPSNTEMVHFRADIVTETKGIVKGRPEYVVTYERKDEQLRIKIEDKTKNYVCIGGSVNIDSRVFVEIPEGIDVTVKNTYGNITAASVRAKTLELKSSSGDISADNVSASMKISSGYGNAKLTNLIGNIDLNLSSGDLSITNLEGAIQAESSYGNLIFKGINGPAKINATSGDVVINSMKGDVTIRSSYGEIRFDGYEGDPDLEAVSGNIIGKNVTLKTFMNAKSSYGNIKMELLNGAEDLSFDLQTNYGMIRIQKGSTKIEEEGKVLIKQGKIMIKGYTASGDQTYK